MLPSPGCNDRGGDGGVKDHNYDGDDYGDTDSDGNGDMMATGLHKLWYPGIRDTSTWSKFGAHGEHGDVFLFSNLGAL